jgi:V8-like Glu-specific endopeptidase
VRLGAVVLALAVLGGPTTRTAEPPKQPVAATRAVPQSAGDSVGHASATLLPPRYRIGALLHLRTPGQHFCTASVVDSPHRDLLITAAHCVHTGPGGGYIGGLAFSPGDPSGQGAAGLWEVSGELVDPAWATLADPDADVAFVAVRRRHGRTIEDVVGANPLAVGRGTGSVGLIGYPDGDDGAHSCSGTASAFGDRQLQVWCPGFTSGTSGSPWIAGADAAGTGDGTVVGVLGGYLRGGSTPDVSYSSLFGRTVASLYRRAIRLP